ncbi:SEP-domain-containing protein [Acaromyces ingoldii]|uniref:SEP-domain-containing protein n=1 Tax=Acaromyces ingoldii TaxID=215250 RepID=A0A316YWW2_9BASI|nr:SEP-domain-containing protein [Acaromyces ingoldii]PWN93927.1 SEP-domain-containing protein [Acaromyces ingoldii]
MDEEISQFVSITGADPEKARFYVESAQGNVETAVSTFFESEAGTTATPSHAEDDADGLAGEFEAAISEATSGPRTLSGAPAPGLPSNWQSHAASSNSQPARSGGIASLRDLRDSAQAPHAAEEDGDDDEKRDRDPAHFYTGGERSGLSVENPNRRARGGNAPDIVQDILQKAAEAGQRAPDEDWGTGGVAARGADARQPSSSSFLGTGRTIGDHGPPSDEQETGGSVPGALSQTKDDDGEDDDDSSSLEPVVRHITFWQDGFTIEDGPLCRYDDPRHAETLAAINNKRAPLHLLNVAFGQPVELRVDKRTNEKYKYTPPPLKAFSGSGNRLGSPAPAMGGAASASASSSAVASVPQSSSPATPAHFEVDSSKPTTQVQIRLGDGQRLIGRFNHDHTVEDMRRYINASRPGMATRGYTLHASFPPKVLEDESLTLKDAGLINAVVIQKWT